MLRNRLIPIILIKDGYAVKSINFRNHKYIGEPINIVQIFNDKEADEIVIYDIDSNNSNNHINFELIKNIASTTRMPLCYGGGLNKIKDVHKIFSFGVEKVSLSSVIFKDINFVKEVSNIFGSQSTAVTLDINLEKDGYFIDKNNYYYNEQKIYELINRLIDLGAGEIIINCVHKDGTLDGFDTILLDKLYNKISTPFTIVGGAKSLEEIKILSSNYKYLGLGVGSLFIYKGSKKAILINYPEEITAKNG
jgi:imidazole glycerol-phosphate synthase subunit HisF